MAERPTPHSVAVCTLIALHSDPSSLIHDNDHLEPVEREIATDMGMSSDQNQDPTNASTNNANANANAYKEQIGEHLSKVIRHLVLHNESRTNTSMNMNANINDPLETMPLSNLLNLISNTNENGNGNGNGNDSHNNTNTTNNNNNNPLKFTHAARVLLEDLQQTFSSIDSLIDLFAAFRATVAQGVIDGDSSHGVYVRKRCLGFDQLGFDSVGRFWEACCDYVEQEVGVGVEYDHEDGHDSDGVVNESLRSCPTDELKHGDGDGDGDDLDESVDLSVAMDETNDEDDGSNDGSDNNNSNNDADMSANIKININTNGHTGRNNDEHDAEHTRTQTQTQVHSQAFRTHNWPLAPGQISRTLLQKCHELDQNKSTIQYDAMESQLHDILEENPELTLGHYLRFMNCANHGERVGALDHFHRYFDYAMIKERKDRLAMPNLPEDTNGNGGNNNNNNNNANNGGGGQGNNNGTNANGSNNGKSNKQKGNVVQYVTIVLAALFHKLGNKDMAHMATLEAIKVAQQSGDGACLAYALGWLHVTSSSSSSTSTSTSTTTATTTGENKDSRDPNQGRLLDRAAARGREYNLHSLIAGTSLHQVILHSNNPAQAWENVAGASASTTQEMNAIGSDIYLNDVPTNILGGAEAFQIIAQQHIVGASIWQSMGRYNMSLATNQLSMHCYDDRMSLDHVAGIASDIAFSVMYGTESDKRRVCRNDNKSSIQGQGTQSLCGAMNRLRKKKKKIKVQKERHGFNLYQAALEKINAIKHDNPTIPGVLYSHSVARIVLEACLRKCDIHSAEPYEIWLHSHAVATGWKDNKVIVQAWGHTCLLLCQKGDWDAAKSMISNVIVPYCQSHDMHFFHCHFLLQLALIYLEGSPDNPTCVIPTLLDCLALSEEYSIDPINASALSLLSRMHFQMDNIERAKSILNAAMPVIVQHCHVFFQGQAWLTMAKCTLSESKSHQAIVDTDLGTLKKKHLLKRALGELEHATDSFEKIQDTIQLREVYYLAANICNTLQSYFKRDAAANKFLHYNKVLVASTRPYWHDALACVIDGQV